MAFYQGTECRNRRGCEVLDQEHRMRVAHGDRADVQRSTINLQGVTFGGGVRDKRDMLGLEPGYAHIHPYHVVSLQIEPDVAGRRAHGELTLGGEALVGDETSEATGAVAALFHLRTGGVEDPVVEVHGRAAGLFYQQDLVAAHTIAPVRQPAAKLGRRHDPLTEGIEDDEVIAQSVHFSKTQTHFLK